MTRHEGTGFRSHVLGGLGTPEKLTDGRKSNDDEN